MKTVLAKQEDLLEIKNIFHKIVNNMISNGITIWNEYYPIEVFEEDIRNNNLYLLFIINIKNNSILMKVNPHTLPNKNNKGFTNITLVGIK